MEFAEPLGISLSACQKHPFDSAAGEADEFEWGEPLTASFGDQAVTLAASFASTPYPLLGREDFFACYRVTIDEQAQTFTLEAYDSDELSTGG